MLLTYVSLLIYIVLLIYIGIQDYSKHDNDSFIIGNRQIGFWGTMSALSVYYRGGSGIVLWIGMGFAGGYKLYHLFFGVIIAMFAYALIIPRVRRIAIERNYLTIGEVVKDFIGVKTEKVSSIIVLLMSVLSLSIQFFVLGHVTNTLIGLSPIISIFASATVIAIYVSLGGYKSIVKTDIVQLFIMLMLWVAIFYIPLRKDQILDFASVVRSETPKEFISAMIYIFVFVFSKPGYWQRIFSAKDDKSCKAAFRVTGFMEIIMSLPLTFIGMAAVGLIPAGTSADDAFYVILEQSSLLPSIFVTLFVLTAVSASMSTADGEIYIFSSTILKDIFKVSVVTEKKKYIILSQIIMISVLIFSSVLALYINNIIDYTLDTIALFLVLAPLFFVAAIGCIDKKYLTPKLDTYFAVSITISTLVGFYMFAKGYFIGFHSKIIPFFISDALLFISYLLVRFSKDSKDRKVEIAK